MTAFEDIEDIEEWLAPLDYASFWNAIAPYDPGTFSREAYDRMIVGKLVDQETVLRILKALVVAHLGRTFGLQHRVVPPATARSLTAVH